MFIRPELGGKVQDVYFSLHTVFTCITKKEILQRLALESTKILKMFHQTSSRVFTRILVYAQQRGVGWDRQIDRQIKESLCASTSQLLRRVQ